MKINLQPGNKAMVSTACTFRFASAFSTSAVHQGRGHISAAQRLLSVFHRGKRKMSCVFSSGSQGRLRGCHLNPCPSISAAAEASLERWLHLIGRRCRRHQARPGQPIPKQGFPSYKLASGLDRII